MKLSIKYIKRTKPIDFITKFMNNNLINDKKYLLNTQFSKKIQINANFIMKLFNDYYKENLKGENTLEDEINLTVVKAEIMPYTETIYGKEKITQYEGIYRYINNNSLVFKGNTETFKFTDENVNKFSQLKYVFKKNNAGKYYVYDIVNLNFEEDYTECN